MENINGYYLLQPFDTANAGTASWTIAQKGEQEYFLKRFNSPKYVPSCQAYCKKYEERKNALYEAIRNLENGNIVVIEDFFHWGTYYYIATQRVAETSITAEKAYTLPKDKLMVVMKTLVHCMMQLERGGIVHADLKPSNVMLKPTVGGFYSLKLIDFDSSFFVSAPPDDLEGDTAYLSPEAYMVMCGEEGVPLTSKIDVFATGIMFHQFLANRLPGFSGEYDSVCEAVANRAELSIAESIPWEFRNLIGEMLSRTPDERPTFAEIFRRLCSMEWVGATKTEASPGASDVRYKTGESGTLPVKNPWMKKAGNL